MLADEIRQRIESASEFLISWKCTYCRQHHSGNLIKKARRVELERSLGVCRPDISLLDETGQVVAVIEVVVSHKPEDVVKEFYRKNRVILIELHLKSEEDLINVCAKLENANYIQLCTDRIRCKKCGHFEEPVEMRIASSDCYNCSASIKVPYIVGDAIRDSYVYPHDFTNRELEIARKYRANIEWQYSRTSNSSYWAITCLRCKKFTGRHYIFTNYIIDAEYNVKTLNINLGSMCHFCVQENEEGHFEEPIYSN